MNRHLIEGSGSGSKRQAKRTMAENRQKRKEIIIMVIMILAATIMVLAAIIVSFWSRWIVEPDIPDIADISKPAMPVQSGNFDYETTLGLLTK